MLGRAQTSGKTRRSTQQLTYFCDCSTNYAFQIQAWNGNIAAGSAWSNVINMTTAEEEVTTASSTQENSTEAAEPTIEETDQG